MIAIKHRDWMRNAEDYQLKEYLDSRWPRVWMKPMCCGNAVIYGDPSWCSYSCTVWIWPDEE